MTREEAIKYAEDKFSKGLYRLDLGYLNRGLYQITAREVDFLRVAISALREQAEWIPVTERLPQLHETALCFKDGRMKIGIYMGAKYADDTAAFRDFQNGFGFGVTHWMPLPEPPKEET